MGALVGRGVEVVRHAAVLLGHAHGGILLVDRVAAERQELLEQSSSAAAVGAYTFSVSRENSSLVRPSCEVLNLERAAALDDLVEDRVEVLRVDEVAFGGDDGGVSVGHDGFGESTPSRPPQEEGRTGGTQMTIAADRWLASPAVGGRRDGVGRSGLASTPRNIVVFASPDLPARPAALRAARAS